MHGFYGFLEPGVVFHQYQNVPDTNEMKRLTEECTRNLAFGRTYVGAKLVAMSLVSAIAVLTGGDAPISLFTGDLRAQQRRKSQVLMERVSDKISKLRLDKKKGKRPKTRRMHKSKEQSKKNHCNRPVYEILVEGRRSETSFDTKRSPWAAELYGYMGDKGLNALLAEHSLYPMTKEKAWKLLRALPRDPVLFIMERIAGHARPRAEKIHDIVSTLQALN
eukprot:jgi/Psemu1/300826/fgenesh1_kg.19_\